MYTLIIVDPFLHHGLQRTPTDSNGLQRRPARRHQIHGGHAAAEHLADALRLPQLGEEAGGALLRHHLGCDRNPGRVLWNAINLDQIQIELVVYMDVDLRSFWKLVQLTMYIYITICR